jgi:AraC family transcriptional regulator, carnitine catabolism transcriptional activator
MTEITESAPPQVRTLGLLLINGFSLMSYAAIVEPFRAANILAGETLYRWIHVSPDGQPARASNGASVAADQAVGQQVECETLFVFAAGDPAAFNDAPTFAWLRQAARRGAVLAGVSGGPYLLARAGLLDGYRATIHWDHRPAFAEAFRHVTVEPSLYVIDRRRVTCAGGAGGMDLAIEMIEREQGHALGARISDWFIRTQARSASAPQRASLRERYGVSNDRVLRVLARMEAAVEEPESRQVLARLAGVSVRQLERLFGAHLGRSIGEAYRQIRLDQAAQLLKKTALSITDIAVACGFRSSSHFSRAYKAHYAVTPVKSRGDSGR